MRTDKEKAFALRGEGKSYRAIHAELGVPMSTLSKWFSGNDWSEGLRRKLVRAGSETRVARMRELNRVRGDRLAKLYERGREEAAGEFERLRHDPLFIAGVSLYLSGGDRKSGDRLRFSTGDMEMGKLYLEFLRRSLGVPQDRVRASLMVYPGQDEQSNRRFWGFALGPGVKFTKSSVVPGRFDARKLSYGICSFTVSSAYLKVKMLEWVKLLPKRLIEGR